MKSMSLFCLLTHLSAVTNSLHAQNILFRSSNEKTMEVPAQLAQGYLRNLEVVPGQEHASLTIEVSYHSHYIKRLIAFSGIENPMGQASKSRYGELLAYIHIFSTVELTRNAAYQRTLSWNEKLSRELTRTIITRVQ